MYGPAHHATGMAAGFATAGLLWDQDPAINPWILVLIIAAGWFGGVAPDRLEMFPGVHVRWIPHRTLTHWGLLWAALLAYALLGLRSPWEEAMVGGFALGGCVHLLGDWPNPTGVPWFWPTAARRHSLNWWRSGQNDGWLSLLAWTVAIIPWLGRVSLLRGDWRAFAHHPVADLVAMGHAGVRVLQAGIRHGVMQGKISSLFSGRMLKFPH